MARAIMVQWVNLHHSFSMNQKIKNVALIWLVLTLIDFSLGLFILWCTGWTFTRCKDLSETMTACGIISAFCALIGAISQTN